MDKNFSINTEKMNVLIADLHQKLQEVYLGGGLKKIEKLHQQNKLTARERIDLLLDKNSERFEIGALAGWEMYEEHGGCPSGGVVVVLGFIHQKMCIVVANDATVKAGAWFPITGKKNLRAQEIAMENNIPIIYLVDSAGVYLPMQDEIFPDKEHFGRIFRNNAQMSAMGIPQIAAVMGSCVAGGAYLPIMSDESLIVKKTGTIFLAGSYLVKAAIGEEVDNETLGGSFTHSHISGVTDYECENDEECLQKIRFLVEQLGFSANAGFSRTEAKNPKRKIEDIIGLLPVERNKPYDIQDIIDCIVDEGEYLEYKENYGKSLWCAYAKIDGWSVGIIANQRKVVKTAKGEMQFGGVIYHDAADKAARFIMNCNQKGNPILFLHDVTGFMVGSRSEQEGIIKSGAKMVNAMANSVVPKFSIVMGNSYGAGNYAMCGKAFDPRLIVAWPTARLAVMGGEQAAKVLHQIQMSSLNNTNLTEEEQKQMFEKTAENYNKQTSPYYAAARLWVDAIINPLETRKFISLAILMANHAPIQKQFKVGVIQT
jgi:acetyl-CoA carboxylase carboxyltransferase component